MKKLGSIKLFALLALGSLNGFSQTSAISPDTIKGEPINTRPTELNRVDTMPRSGIQVGVENKNSNSVALRKPNKKELAAVAPNPEDATKYAAFLGKDGTGLTRLVPDIGCDTNKNVVDVSNKCATFTMPGGGSSFSFRLGRYVGNYFSDLVLKEKALAVAGNLNLGFFLMLGDVPLENVSPQTAGAGFLFDFVPPKEATAVVKEAENFAKGAVNQDYIYKSVVPVTENTTYLFRLVAYRRETAQPLVQNPDFNDIEIDKRKDIVVAFRVVRKDADGSVTISGRSSRRKDAPKLEKSK